MNKVLKGVVFVLILLVPFAFYFFRSNLDTTKHKNSKHTVRYVTHVATPAVYRPGQGGAERKNPVVKKPKVAIIFDDLGGSLSEMRQLYSLGVPLTIAIIPTLKYSSNVAYFANRCGFSVLVHLPMEPGSTALYKKASYKFITRKMSDKEINALLKYYLNSIPLAIGVNNHMGSSATRDERVMSLVLDAIKQKDFIFIDSRTALDSIAYNMAIKKGVIADFNHGFIDAENDQAAIEKKIDYLEKESLERGRMVIIGHPRKSTIAALRNKIAALKEKVEFVTIKDYLLQ